jgi:hypothetical protein
MSRILSNRKGHRNQIVEPRPKFANRVFSEGAIGVTLVSPRYAHMEQEAVDRFRRNTGLECVIINTGNEKDPAFSAKLNLDLLVAARPIVFFDVDLWILRPVDFRELATSGKWCAVPDPCAHNLGSFCGKDSQREGWDPDTYFNSGLFACDLSRPEIRRVFEDARAQLDRVIVGEVPPPVDSTDQYYLNWAVHQQPDLLKPLPLHYNFFNIAVHHGDVTHIPVPLIGLHAAGVLLPQKLEVLRKQAFVFGPPEDGVFHHGPSLPIK